jgi:CRISPR-associated protein Cmr5
MAVGSGKSSNHPTLEQQRAAHALNRVRTVENAPNVSEKQKSRYRSYVESLPATIVMNGLGQACATLLASSNGADDDSNGDGKSRARAYRDLHKHLEDWLCRDDDGVYRGQKPLIDAIVSRGQSEYVHAQAEALAYLVWLKKFSQAFLPRGDRD